jgi:hypothetical protein
MHRGCFGQAAASAHGMLYPACVPALRLLSQISRGHRTPLGHQLLAAASTTLDLMGQHVTVKR